MKASGVLRGWRPLVGILSVGVLAFALRIEGAPKPKGTGKSTSHVARPADQPATTSELGKIDATTPADAGSGVTNKIAIGGTQERVIAGPGFPQSDVNSAMRLGRVVGDIPVAPTETINPYDDDMTRARQQGIELDPRTGRPVGQGAVARGGCSFNIECDDCDPCTQDFCDIGAGDPLGSGSCSNVALSDGQVGGCSDGLCCNGLEACVGGVCTPNGAQFDPAACDFPCTGANVCDEFDNQCKPACTTNAQCDDGLVCNGVETCSTGAVGDPPAGVCKRGDNPCGTGATCGEKRCSQLQGNPPFCTTDADCANGTCTVNGPICFPGRCCLNGSPEPACTRRARAISFQGTPSCNSVSGVWYPGDAGDTLLQGTGSTCLAPTANDPGVKCPKYSSGIAPIIDFDTEVALVLGPFSAGATCDHFSIGDDYTLSNPVATLNHIAVDHFRWIGATELVDVNSGRVVIEFRDAAGNIIEDFVTGTVGTALAIRSHILDPAIVIPPNGYVTARPAPQFSPNGRVFWATTDVVDVGTNDVDKIWFDGAIVDGSTTIVRECVGGENDGAWCDPVEAGADCPLGTCTTRPHVLAFEIEGLKAPEPLGACCDNSDGSCEGNVEWLCEGTGDGSFVGTGSFCNFCSAGANTGRNCRFCVGGTNANNVCQRASDCPSGTCSSNASACGNKCAGGANINAPCLDNGDCPGSTCTIGGNPGSSCIANATCGVGACCNANTGACTVGPSGACSGAGLTFQGFGTDCDSDNSHDAGEQHCCEQPDSIRACDDTAFPGADDLYIKVDSNGNKLNCTLPNTNCDVGDNCVNVAARQSGGDDCEDAILHKIAVPSPGSDPITITISGDNSTASGQDSCGDTPFDITTPGADPGWWEGFELDACAYVRIDFCCTNPTQEPQWSFMYRDCPCNGNATVATAVDPDAEDEAAVARGGPYCGDDDNLWMKFGPLAAGKFYLPIYSVLAGHHGPYQMHVTVKACPVAACCDGNSCSLNNTLECAAIDGATFLAPPLRPTAVTTCDVNTCATGSCCTAPGVCKDQIPDNGPLATLATCGGVNGEYHGGIRCKGGTCSNDANKSCSQDADCPGGGCLGDDDDLGQPSPCPPCAFSDQAHCQLGAGAFIRLSDLCVGDCVADPDPFGAVATVADDFISGETGSITAVCVVGAFRTNPGLGTSCAASNPPETFRITIYNDNNGVPGTTVVQTPGIVIAKALALGTDLYQWQLQLTTPAAVQQGQKYWLEVVNNTRSDVGGAPTCDWLWLDSDDQIEYGNNYAMQNFGGAYTAADAVDGADMRWCLSVANTRDAAPTRACCTCDGQCNVQTVEDCRAADGDWVFSEIDCAGVNCRTAADAADVCGTQALTVTDGATSFNNFCATTDGPPNLTCEASPTQVQKDLWFKYTATCDGQLTVNTCDLQEEYDMVMAIYHDPAAPTVCDCPGNTGFAQLGDCNDDGCSFSGGGSQLIIPSVTTGQCFTIRVGGFEGVIGNGTLHITCANESGPEAVIPSDTKVRYISFNVPASAAAAGETAIRVTFTSLMVPNPPNLPQFPAPNFSSFNGQVRWVGAVANCVENEAPPVSFKCATLQCAPVYANFNALLGGAVLHVTGDGVVPSSTLTVHQLAASCAGNEAGCTSVSDAVVFSTLRWGDVGPPFQAPSPAALNQPNISDVAKIVDKFKGVAGAQIVASVDLHPEVPNRVANIADVAACVDGFKGFAYPFDGPCTCGQPGCP